MAWRQKVAFDLALFVMGGSIEGLEHQGGSELDGCNLYLTHPVES